MKYDLLVKILNQYFFFQSLCGKNLTTILNEYVAMKTKGKPSEWDFILFFVFICCELLEEDVVFQTSSNFRCLVAFLIFC